MSMSLEMNPTTDSFTRLLDQQEYTLPEMAQPNAALVQGNNMVGNPTVVKMEPFQQAHAANNITKAQAQLVKPEKTEAPNALQNLIWTPTWDENQPGNATEAALLQLIDDKLQVTSAASIDKFLNLLEDAKAEPEKAFMLVILRATATSSNTKVSRACTNAFEKRGGLKIARRWLEEAVEWNYSDLLVLLLDVLKQLPLQLASITEARINEPIVKLRKDAREEKVKRAAQDLLKFWRSRFTAKEKPKPQATPASTGTATSLPSADQKKALPPSTGAATPTASAQASSVSSSNSPLKKPSDLVSKESKPVKRRSIKRLERLPFGGGNAVSKSSDLIGNLMQRKNAKDAAAAAAAASSKAQSDSVAETKSVASKDSSSDSKSSSLNNTGGDGFASSSDSSHATSTSSKDEDVLAMQLPTIQSFNAAVASTTSMSKKIRWADDEGQELVKVKFIESWRDMVQHTQHDESSFRDAKLREHADERNALKSNKEKFTVAAVHEWSTPVLVQLPEALAGRRKAVATDEIIVQNSRTRREMEYLVLDGETPPTSPKEWVRGNEPQRSSPFEIPLSDLEPAATNNATFNAAPYGQQQQGYGEVESEEDRALREALGPLQKSTIALLLDNEDILPQVYDEAQRNGNRIPDVRVIEILEQRRYQQRQQQQQQRFHQPPPSLNRYGGNAGHNNSNYVPPGGGYDYNRAAAPPMGGHQYQQHAPPITGKRKAPLGSGAGGGILSDAPPAAKRLMKKGPATQPCMYFNTPTGCKHGNACQYSHEFGGPGPMNGGPGGASNEYIYNQQHMMPPNSGGGHVGGRFGHGHPPPPMGMRGHGIPRQMRGGR